MFDAQINHVENCLSAFETDLIKKDALKSSYLSQLDNKIVECNKLEDTGKLLMSSLALLEQCNIAARDFVKTEVEQLVTQGLRSIFENDAIQFNIEFVSKRNQIEAEFVVTKDNVQGDILYTNGGGIVDVISMALRIVIMQLMKIKGPLILDEPGKYISAQFIGSFGKFLTEVANTFNRQIIMVTHNSKLMEFANNTIEIKQSNGVAYVK